MTRGWMSNFSLIFNQFLRFFSYIQYTLGSFPIGIFKNLQFFIINDMQESLNLLIFCVFWVIFTHFDTKIFFFWLVFGTCEIPLHATSNAPKSPSKPWLLTLKKYVKKSIKKWNNMWFFVLLVKKNVVRFKIWPLFVTKNDIFAFPYLFVKRLNECVCDVKTRKIDFMQYKSSWSSNN